MKFSYCVCDLDGTLLNDKDLITEKNAAALKKLQDKGVEVVIASGRTELLMKQYISQLNIRYLIACNGAVVKDTAENKMIYSRMLARDVAAYIVNYFFHHGLNFLVYTESSVLSNKGNQRAEYLESVNKSLPIHQRTPITYFDADTMRIMDKEEIIKILLVEKNKHICDWVFNQLKKFSNISMVSSARGMLDIWASGISKGSALKELSRKLQINLEEVIAFGDNYNDIELLQEVGMPIAMGNAVDEIKKVAKFITLSNKEDGIAYAIDHYIKLW